MKFKKGLTQNHKRFFFILYLLFCEKQRHKQKVPVLFALIAQIAFKNKEDQQKLNQVQQLDSIIDKVELMSRRL